MPYDILMCTGGECPQKETCLRFTGKIYGRTDFFGYPPYQLNPFYCDFYWSDRPHREHIEKLAYKLWEEENYPQNRALENWLIAESILIHSLREN